MSRNQAPLMEVQEVSENPEAANNPDLLCSKLSVNEGANLVTEQDEPFSKVPRTKLASHMAIQSSIQRKKKAAVVKDQLSKVGSTQMTDSSTVLQQTYSIRKSIEPMRSPPTRKSSQVKKGLVA